MSSTRSLHPPIMAGILALAVLASSACAAGASSNQGWTTATSAEVSGEDDTARATSPVRFLSAQGDFDGDGKRDQAQLVVNRGTGVYGVKFTFGADRRQHVEPIGPLAAIKSAGLRATPAGGYEGCIESGPRCEKQRVSTKADGVVLFAFESSERLMYWDAKVLKAAYLSD